MKKNDHPDYHFIEVTLTTGESFKTRSTYGKEGEKIGLNMHRKKTKGFMNKTGLIWSLQ